MSPSGSASQTGSAKFSPANKVTDSIKVSFPQFSEPGAWIVVSAMVADVAGNTLILDRDALASKGAKTLQVR